MPDLPTGTVTFLYTDIEGSTKRWELDPGAMKAAVARHDVLVREAIETGGGAVFRRMGDAFCAAFSSAPQAVDTVLLAQKAILTEEWDPAVAPIRVRIALHTGLGEVRDGDYVGAHLNRVARLLSTAHGGQTLLSGATYELVCDLLPEGVSLRDLGQHKLKDLQRPEHVYQLVSADLPSDFPPILILNTIANNLPAQPTEFIGRERELEGVCELLCRPQVRLVTLSGPGGTGKTRISLQVGANVLEKFRDGVFFVPLTSVSDPALVPEAIAESLKLGETGDRPAKDSLKEYLRQKEMLLILDNFEQVVGAAPVVGELLAAAPHLRMLVTSREVLHVYGEKEFPIPPLQLPDLRHLPPIERLADYESVRLFVERATSAKPDFELTPDNAAPIAEICTRLDGLPLAIELAAARTRLLSPQAILSRLESRLKLLTSGSRDLPARQQTLRGAIDWSYHLLSPDEAMLFRRLSVFVGGCTLEATEAVCELPIADFKLQNDGDSNTLQSTIYNSQSIDLLDGLGSLVDKSLLRQVEQPEGESRFVMLETLREYAHEQLEGCGELDAMRAQHAHYYLSLAEQFEVEVLGAKQKQGLQRAEREHDNLRAALEWTISERGNREIGLRIGSALYRFWHTAGYLAEGRRWMTALLDGVTGRTTLTAKSLYAAGYMVFLLGDLPAARTLLEESAAMSRELGETLWLAYALHILGAVTAFGNDPEEGRAISAEATAIFRRLGLEGKSGLVLSLLTGGVLTLLQGDYSASQTALEEARLVSRELGDDYMRAQASTYLGDLARIECDYARAGAYYEESLPVFRDFRGRGDVPALLHNMGYVALAARDYARAWDLFRESLALQQEIENKQGLAECLSGFASLAAAQDDAHKAARLFGATEALRQSSGAYMWPAERVEWERNLAGAKAQLDEAAWERAWAEGKDMAVEKAIKYALVTA
jgi:predicted ATPase/class 3 adenylate cyclase